jgi:hypothetical protein
VKKKCYLVSISPFGVSLSRVNVRISLLNVIILLFGDDAVRFLASYGDMNDDPLGNPDKDVGCHDRIGNNDFGFQGMKLPSLRRVLEETRNDDAKDLKVLGVGPASIFRA